VIMTSVVQRLTEAGIAEPPPWLPPLVQYEVINGSIAYGVSTDDSDFDVYGFCIPHLDVIFPHLRGEILGFGNQLKRFNMYQQHHLMDHSARGGKGREYDISIYNIVSFFQLCMKGNPNMVNTLFAAQEHVIHGTRIAQYVRENRKLFLHKGCWHGYKGYSYAQMKKMKHSKNSEAASELRDFEKDHGIPHSTKLVEVKEEIVRRGLNRL